MLAHYDITRRRINLVANGAKRTLSQIYEYTALVGRYTALVDGIVVGYGGTVDKHIGDAVMALFGAPRAHDDDPMRAARAALDIHEALAQLSETASRPLQAHVGIANGEVVAGTVGRADVHDYTVLGEVVNNAARLQRAPLAKGHILVDEAVQKRIEHTFQTTPLGPLDPARADFYSERGLRTVCPTKTAIDSLMDAVRSCGLVPPLEVTR